MKGITSQAETTNLRRLLREIAESAKTVNLYSDSEYKYLVMIGKVVSRPYTDYESNFISTIHCRIL